MMKTSAVVAFAIVLASLIVRADIPANANALFDVGDYVQEGLIVHLDGIRNAGADAPHDASAATWKDLKGLLDFSVLANGSWGADYFAFSGPSASAATAAPLYRTIEARVAARGNATKDGFFFYSGNKKTYSSRFLIEYVNGPGYYFELQSDKQNQWLPIPDKTVPTTVAATYGTDNLIQSVVSNGVIRTCSTKATYFGYVSSSAVIGDRRTDSSAVPGYGKFYALRLYDRVLNATELAYNSCVDMVRFEDADPALLPWPEPYGYNSDTETVETTVSVTAENGGYVNVGDGWNTNGEFAVAFVSRKTAVIPISARPPAGYEFKYWKLNGNIVGTAPDLQLNASLLSDNSANSVTAEFRVALNYVQDGLITHLDGIHNAGADVPHDSHTNIWKDLKGNLDFSVLANGSWANNHFVFSGPSAVAATAAPAYKTIEARVASRGGATKNGFFFYSGNKKTYSSQFLIERIAGGYYFELEQNVNIKYLPMTDNTVTTTVAATYNSDVRIDSVISNGVVCAGAMVSSYYGVDLRAAIIGDRKTSSTAYPGYGKFFALRLYDRVLSETELLYNNYVDMVRFDDVDPSTIQWPSGFRYNQASCTVELFVPVSITGSGKICIDDSGSWNEEGEFAVAYDVTGQTVKLSARPDDGNEFVQWKLNGGVISTMRTFDFDADLLCTGPNEITAEFRPRQRDNVFNELLVKEGLVYRLDASDVSSVTLDNGRVTEWRPVECGSASVGLAFTNSTPAKCPTYVTDAFATGLPGILLCGQLTDNGNGTITTNWLQTPLVANMSTHARTVFLVERRMESTDIDRLFGSGSRFIINRATITETHGWAYGTAKDAPEGLLFLNGVCVAAPGTPALTEITSYNGSKLTTGTPAASSTAVVTQWLPEDYVGANWFVHSTTRQFRGSVGEVIVYDRELTGAEIRSVNAYLCNKWRGTGTATVNAWKNTVWTGEGGDTDWNNADNWSAGVPTEKSSVLISGASVTVTGTNVIENLRLRDATLTLASGARLDAINLFSSEGEDAVTVGTGARFLVSEDVSDRKHRFALTLNNGEFVYSPRFTIDFNQEADPINHIIPRESYMDVRTLPCTVTGTGTIIKSGAGTVALDADLPSGVSLNVSGGRVDLCGRDLALSGLSGMGYLDNSSDRIPTVTVDNDEDIDLGVVALSKVNLVKRGDGCATVRGSYGKGGTLTVEEGAAASDGLLAPESIPGLVVHLDASRPETIIKGEGDRITAWLSSGGIVDRFITDPTKTRSGQNRATTAPRFSPTALNGKPGMLFSTNASGTGRNDSETNTLVSCVVVTNRSVFMVVKPVYRFDAAGDIYYSELFNTTSWTLDLAYANKNTSLYLWSASAGARTYLNGAKVYDSVEGVTDYTYRLTKMGYPQVIGYTRPQSDCSSANAFRPCVGGGHHTYTQRRAAAVISEVIAYENEISDEDAKRLSASLMKKWGITFNTSVITGETHQVTNALGDDAKIALKPNTSLDLGGVSQSITSIAIDGGDTPASASISVTNGAIVPESVSVATTANGAFPCVTGDADWLVDDTDFAFSPNQPVNGKLVKTSGRVSGTPGETTGSKKPISVSPHSLGFDSGFILFVR